MNNQKYHLNISFKTKVLNSFRKILMMNVLEKKLVSIQLNGNNKFVEKLIPPNYLYKKGSSRTINRDGVNYILDISNVVDHSLYFGFKDESYNSIINDIKSSKVIFDVGANIGTTTLYFSKLNPQSKIYSFEPHPDTFVKLSRNISVNENQNIQLNNIGLGEQKDTLKLYEVNEKNPGMNRIISEDKKLPFKLINIDSIKDFVVENKIDNIDFIKIDVEGFELSVLKGGEKIISKTKPIIFLELDDNNLRENGVSAKELIEYLFSLGYKKIIRADKMEMITAESNFDNCHYDIISRMK